MVFVLSTSFHVPTQLRLADRQQFLQVVLLCRSTQHLTRDRVDLDQPVGGLGVEGVPADHDDSRDHGDREDSERPRRIRTAVPPVPSASEGPAASRGNRRGACSRGRAPGSAVAWNPPTVVDLDPRRAEQAKWLS